MLGAIRRCPPPTRLRIFSSTCSSTSSLQAIASIASTRPSTRLTALPQIPSFRSLHVSPLRWNSSHEAAVEAQIEQDAAGAQPPEGADVDKATQLGNIDRFSDLEREGLVHHKIIKNIAAMKIETMTQVQSLTINEALTGKDIVAQAKTGTGKTLAFLLPIIQRIISQDPQLAVCCLICGCRMSSSRQQFSATTTVLPSCTSTANQSGTKPPNAGAAPATIAANAIVRFCTTTLLTLMRH